MSLLQIPPPLFWVNEQVVVRQDATQQTMRIGGLQRTNGVYLYLVEGCEGWVAEPELQPLSVGLDGA